MHFFIMAQQQTLKNKKKLINTTIPDRISAKKLRDIMALKLAKIELLKHFPEMSDFLVA